MLWDKRVNRQDQSEFNDARVSQKPYVYLSSIPPSELPRPMSNWPSGPNADLPHMPSVIDHVAVARLYGEPLFAMPQDLYIPPDALQIFSRSI
jgi:hypothetical protein